MNLSNRDRRAVLLGAALLAALGLAQWIVLPWIADWRDARSRITAARFELTELETQVRRLVTQRRRLREALGPAVGKPLPSADEARVRFVQIAERIMAAGGIKTSGVRPQPARPLQDVEGVSLVTLRAEGVGRSDRLAACLAAVHELDEWILIDQISVTEQRGRPGQVAVSLVLAAPARQEQSP